MRLYSFPVLSKSVLDLKKIYNIHLLLLTVSVFWGTSYVAAKIGAVKTAAFNYFNPVMASLAGLIVFHEQVTIYIALGGCLVILGVYITNQKMRLSISRFLPMRKYKHS